MLLKVFSPIELILETEILKVDFEAIDGFFTLLPRHTDFVSALAPCVVSYQTPNKKTAYMACNQGVIVKKGPDVQISTKLAVLGDDLEKLRKTIEIDFKQMEEIRKESNKTMARLELGLTKGLMQLHQNGGNNAGL